MGSIPYLLIYYIYYVKYVAKLTNTGFESVEPYVNGT